MEETRCENNSIEGKNYELYLIIKEFRELISMYRFRFIKKSTRILRKSLRNYEKIVNDEKGDDIEYLKDQVNSLKNLKNLYIIKINITTTKFSILVLMKPLNTCLKMKMKTTIFMSLINNINHFLVRFYYIKL